MDNQQLNISLDGDDIVTRLKTYLNNFYLDVQLGSAPASGEEVVEDYVIKLITRLIVSVCTSWYAIVEVIDYLKKRRLLKDLTSASAWS